MNNKQLAVTGDGVGVRFVTRAVLVVLNPIRACIGRILDIVYWLYYAVRDPQTRRERSAWFIVTIGGGFIVLYIALGLYRYYDFKSPDPSIELTSYLDWWWVRLFHS